jgi:hypothetical protein
MADLYAYAHLLAERKRRAPGRDDVMSILLTEIDFAGGRVSPEEFREPVLALRRRRQRDAAQGPTRSHGGVVGAPGGPAAAARPSPVAGHGGRRTAAVVDAGDDLPPNGHGGGHAGWCASAGEDKGRRLVHVRQPGRSANRDDRSFLSSQGTLADPEAVARAVAQPRALPRYREKMPSWLLVSASPEERNRANCPRRAPSRALSPEE